ncbi:MAG: hypothetical protein J6J05_01035 [Peptococcaceae bacterium]|nr:hypothetical protein [Peptococcaceae bacterium]
MNLYLKIKKQWMILFLLCGVLFLNGCTLELPTPESLIAAPESNQELMQQKQMISEFLSKEERMIVPEINEIGTAYQYINLDEDDEKEIVVFYANKESNFVLGFMILDQREAGWQLLYKTTAYGTDIHYFSVQDLNLDGAPEFLLGVKTGYGAMKELYVYHLADSGLIDITSEDRIAYDQIVLAEPTDGQTMLVTARTDTTVLVGSSNITIYTYGNNMVYPVYNNTFDGYCSDMRFAKVNADTEGIYMAMRYNHYINMILLCETETGFTVAMEHPMPYDYEEMAGIELFGDINNDGILEVNSLWSPENNLSNRDYRDFVHVWLQWDGENGLTAISAILENRTDGYRFLIPVQWMDTLYYDFYTDGEIEWTEFYYENEERSFETVFSLAAVDQLVWQNMDDEVTDSIVVLGNHPTLNKVYIANIKTELFNEFQVDAEKLISCLQIEGGM